MKKIIAILVAIIGILSFQLYRSHQNNQQEKSEIVSYKLVSESSWNEGYISEESKNTDDTGKFYDSLNDMQKYIYDGIVASGGVSAQCNSVAFRVEYSDENDMNAKWVPYSKNYSVALYAYMRDYEKELLFTTDEVFLDAEVYENYYNVIVGFVVSEHYNETIQKQASEAIAAIMSECPEGSTYLQVKYFHDWIVLNSEYDYDALDAEYYDESRYLGHCALGCLLEGKGLCESYAELFKILCDEANIPCLVITTANHCFNYVKMEDGKWYMVDCTWDDPKGEENYTDQYFLVSNSPYINEDHTPDNYFDYVETADSNYVCNHNYEKTIVEPGYSHEGYTLYQCTNCLDSFQKDKLCRLQLPYTDIEENKWYVPYLEKAYDLGLMSGKSENIFDPHGNMNRGQVAVVLYRMSGEKIAYDSCFIDVSDGKYYSEAVTWCYRNKMITGYSDQTFRPANPVTRQDFVLMLDRYMKYKGVNSSNRTDLSAYLDASSVSEYALEAVQWAVESGIISGKTRDGKVLLCPKETATRAECCKMLVAANELTKK